MFPALLILGAGAFGAYKLWGEKTPHKAPLPASAAAAVPGGHAAPLVANVASVGRTVTTAIATAAGGQPTAVTDTQVTDPIFATASLAANALLHGAATDPGVQQLVRAFQAAGGLAADGKYGPKTQALLQRYLPNAPAAPPVYGGPG